ncbi:zinc finger protein 532 isoform X1 [Microcaecilia unicolor]|uniref:Zinc finger protein 532 n=2 Tax=Microcaecilia unicolor TaxID=1415580 RepID=A0A6P7WZZ6_9AMPH|nr:zinc finger protein 532 isoform X1 [Microcaecilia unicolor]
MKDLHLKRYTNMGDMKTPDFDDLLAAFDIPDMVDPKAAIESGHDDHEIHMKQNAHTDDDSHAPSSSDVGVSVIVKNVRNIDSSDGMEKDSHNSTGNGLHNGFLTVSALERFNKEGGKSLKEEGPVSEPTLKECTFNQFSPISSAEEFDDDEKIEVDDPPDKEERRPNFTANVLTGSISQQEYERIRALGEENLNKACVSAASNVDKNKLHKQETETSSISVSVYETFKTRKLDDNSEKVLESSVFDGKVSNEKSEANSSVSQSKSKSSAKLSSCIAAIAALSAKKAATDICKDTQSDSRGSSPLTKEVTVSPRAAEGSLESQSLIDGVKKPLKPSDSPRSVSSESSSKGSPSSPAGSTPAIPKVRIKTIKMSSGEIKRTVTRVLPEFEMDCGKKSTDQTTSIVVSSLLSSPASAAVLSSPPRTSLQPAVVTNAIAPSPDLTPKQVTIKPVATAFLPVSAVKTAGSQVINLKLSNNTTVKATVISAASVQSASSAIIKAASAIQQQTVVVPASSLASAKLVPKTVHLANLNLLPQSAQTTSELRQVLTKSQHQIKQALISAANTQPVKKVSRVHVVASSQSSVVEAFNKVLSSVNPVPIYVPNLSPPTNAGINLPSRGYKCLECGDSFALEKSLMQHYDRRSVRIEVTCNHCTKNLVFYNKCSLLSHARGHKEKGVVMQCSHLILKPVPADQMIAATSSNTSATLSIPLLSPMGAGTHTVTKIQSGITGTVISAPLSTPIIPAMPLDEDPSKLCRHSLKCLECNEVFPDETSLATHFQQAADTSAQKTCSICQMLLPNQCSFASHQRIHQHKSPYTCPECGAICRSVHFQTHVTKNCLHYTRRVGFRCVHCNVVYSDVAALKSHIQGSHCEVFYKCPICPMAFKSAPSTHSHAYTQHPGVKIGEPKVIYKCSMCDTVFTLQPLLYRHFDQHIENQKVSVFKCPDCSLLYAQKQLMMDHIKSMHGTLKSIEGPPNLSINLPLSTKPTTQNSAGNNREETKLINGTERPERSTLPVKKGGAPKKANNPGWTCWECDQLFTQRDVYIAHMKKEHGKQMKKHPCRQCDKSFSSSHSLCRHNRIKHKGIRKVYTCSHCPDSKRTFTKRLMLEKHIQLMHGIKNPDVKEMTDSVPVKEAVQEVNKAPSPKRKMEEAVVEFKPPKGAITQPLKKLKINVFKVHKCAVCGFTTENLLQFHEHIPQHKSDGSSYQCRECGLCYTSHVSLSRHLFIVHKLKEPQPVSKQNGSGEDHQQGNNPSPEDESSDNTSSERKCKVCAKTFETEAALNTHMRTHGMAFIKSKRMSSSEK